MAITLIDGNKLPDLPDYDKGQYPYAVILSDIGTYKLHLCKEPVTVGRPEYDMQAIIIPTGCELWSIGVGVGSVWDLLGRREYEMHILGVDNIMWSDHDIINEDDGTVFFAASDPVPVTTPQDFYIVKNGVGQKQDVYLRVNGQCVKQEEYLS